MDEKEIYLQIQKGSSRALKDLVEANLDDLWPIARSLAKMAGKWTPEDLFQEGALAMVRFAERWKPQDGIPFAAACRQRVRGAMKDFLRRKADTMRGQDGQLLSLDAPNVLDDSSSSLSDRIANEVVWEEEEEVMNLPDSITTIERTVLELRVLARTPISVDQAATKLMKTPLQIRQIQRRAMRKLSEVLV